MADQDRDKARDGLLEDLESLRSVLDKDQRGVGAADTSAAETGAALLPEAVSDAPSLEEVPLDVEPATSSADGASDDVLISALLTQSWKASAAEILRESRADIEQHSSRWLPEDTDRLNSALKTRIDDTLRSWIQNVLRRNLDELHSVLLTTIEEQLREQIAEILDERADRTQPASGPSEPSRPR